MKYLICLLLLLPIAGKSQEAFYNEYDWKRVPEKFELTSEEKIMDEVVLFEKKSIEYVSTNDGLGCFSLLHKITRLNSDKAIEENNKYYVAMGESAEIVILKARVIKPNGDITKLSTSDIQQALDDKGNVKYHYFALEGIEKGSDIEIVQLRSVRPVLTGARMILQDESFKRKVEADIIYPEFLDFQLYCVNGLPDFSEEYSEDSTRTIRKISVENMRALEDEDWSAYDNNTQKVYYKLSKNRSTGKGNFYNYAEVTKRVYEIMYTPLNSKEKKIINKFISQNTGDAQNNLDKIRNIENALKKEIHVIDSYFEGVNDISQIFKSKLTTDDGMTKVMLNILREMNVPFELVLTSNRLEEHFLEEFQGYNFLEEYLLHIIEGDTYFSSELSSRIGFPPYRLTYNKGLFVSEVAVAGYNAGVGKVKYINGIDYSQSIDEIDTKLTFSEDLTSCAVDLYRSNSGYKAMFLQPYMDFLDENQKKEALDDFLKYLDENSKLDNPVFENDHSADFGKKPLIGKAVVHSELFIENAGDKVLLKAGLLIGPQAEMYNEKPREQPVDSYYTRGYNRTITIVVPEGYEVKNPEALQFDVQPDKEKNLLGFVSTYEVKGNEIIVHVKEWYNTVFFSVEEYPMYRDTMNAAADFNKVVLVLQKK